MKVILLKDDKKLGKKGSIVEVAEGYARNFLLPKQVAVIADEKNMQQAKQQQSTEKFHAQVREDQAKILASQISKVELTILVKVGENGKLFGSVNSKDVADALINETKLDIDRRKVELKEPIKATGDYKAVAKLHPSITAEFIVHVKEA